MNPTDKGLSLAVGVSGSGKTFGVEESVKAATGAGMPVLVLDRMYEWGRHPDYPGKIVLPKTCRAATAANVQEAANLVAKGYRLILIRPPPGTGANAPALAESMCQWARDYPGRAGVAIPEAHRIAPNGHPLSPALEDCATQWRHWDVRLWLDTQRLALLSKTLTEQASEIRIYAVFGARDLQVIKDWGTPALVEAVSECARRLAAGEPGYCVRLGYVRTGPFVAERVACRPA